MRFRLSERGGRKSAAGVVIFVFLWFIWELLKDSVFGVINQALARRWELIGPEFQQHLPSAWHWAPGILLALSALLCVRIVYRLGQEDAPPHLVGSPIRVSYGRWDSIDPLRVIDAAHLWVEEHPPGQGSNKVSERANPIFQSLHAAIEAGGLLVSKERQGRGGSTRWVGRHSLRKYASSIGEKPKFLFRESR